MGVVDTAVGIHIQTLGHLIHCRHFALAWHTVRAVQVLQDLNQSIYHLLILLGYGEKLPGQFLTCY